MSHFRASLFLLRRKLAPLHISSSHIFQVWILMHHEHHTREKAGTHTNTLKRSHIHVSCGSIDDVIQEVLYDNVNNIILLYYFGYDLIITCTPSLIVTSRHSGEQLLSVGAVGRHRSTWVPSFLGCV